MGELPRTSRVYIVSATSLFAQGIWSLLGGEPSIEILGVESDLTKAIESARSLRPDVIIAEEYRPGLDAIAIGELLQEGAAARVVILNLNDNFVTVYACHRTSTTCRADLIRVIRAHFWTRELQNNTNVSS